MIGWLGLAHIASGTAYIELYRVQHRPASELVTVAQAALGGQGVVTLDARTATLILNGTPASIQRALALLERLDQPLRSVVLKHQLRTASDLDALDVLASAPLRRVIRGGVVTYREGFESDLPAWHWTPDQRRALPSSARRFVFSCYADNPYLNTAIVDLLYRLAGDRRKFFITDQTDLDFLRYGFGDAFTQSGNLVEADNPEVPVAADQANR